MLEPCFNELSVHPLCLNEEDVKNRLSALASLLSKLRTYGIEHILIENGLSDISLMEHLDLAQYCRGLLTNGRNHNNDERNKVNLFYSMFRAPYLAEDKENLFATYSDVKYITESGEEKNCYGLYIAHLLKSFAVGVDTGIKSPCKLKLISKNEQVGPEEVEIIHVSRVEQMIQDRQFAKFMSNMQDLKVKRVDAASKKTTFTVPMHHGKKECEEHGRSLLKHPYVKDILSSISWNPSEKSYIHQVNPDGSIEVRLYWTKKGFGLLVSTSATDLVESYWVAKLLNDKYGNSK